MSNKNNTLQIDIKFKKSTYSLGAYEYDFHEGGHVLVGKAIFTEEDKLNTLKMTMDMAVRHMAEKLSKEIADKAFVKYRREIKKIVAKHIEDNKDSLIQEFVDRSLKRVTARIQDEYNNYGAWNA